MLLIIGSILVSAYLGLMLFMYLFQSRLVYFPSRRIDITPEHIGLKFEDLYFTAEDGTSLNAWYIPSPSSQATILFCHGNAGNISNRVESIEQFHRLGLNVFIFDYRGYGLSKGNPNEEGTYQDALAAWKYLIERKGLQPDEIIIFGRSLGGAVALWLATQTEPRGLIVESSFTSIPNLASKLYPFIPVRLLSRFHYNSEEIIEQIRVPVLVVHSRQDDIIPYGHGEILFARAGEPKQFLEISGLHNDGYLISGDNYLRGLSAFIRNHLNLTLENQIPDGL